MKLQPRADIDIFNAVDEVRVIAKVTRQYALRQEGSGKKPL